MPPVTDYIATTTPTQQAIFTQMCATIFQAAPTAEQGISYGMPAFLYRGKGLLSFQVTKKFLSCYPFSGKVISKLADQLTGYHTTSGAIHFSETHPLTEELLKEIIRLRLQEIEVKLNQ